ncbi:MAG TPA: hypothetical protein VFP09_02860 [Desertimonas sp.]|nr:hypothetical protein [Desertimonas sp.]
MSVRPSRTNLIHIGIMAAVLIGSLVTVALASGGIGSTGTPGAATASNSGDTANKPDKTKKTDKADKAKSVAVTVTGTLGTRIAADGSTEYTLTSGDTLLLLDAGPAWFFRDAYPLAPFVGKQVTIGGQQKEGSTSVDVVTVDGTALREPGKPPWAGGWKKVGKDHPGWTQEKADRQAAKQADRAARRAAKMERFGLQCWPPGLCKDRSASDVNPGASTAP